MSLKQKVLPPSSASFHFFEQQVYSAEDALARKLDHLTQLVEKQSEELARLPQLERRIEALSRTTRYYHEALLGADADDSKAARLKLFRQLPIASGKTRQSQIATAKLMSHLHQILEREHIEYWFDYGSLLGAIVRHGFIPWDDDIDICILRDGLERLMKVLEHDRRFQITIVYDFYALCIQYRFCSRDYYNPTFIDLGVWDYATKFTEAKERQIQTIRSELMDALRSASLDYWYEQKYLFDPKSGSTISGALTPHPDRQDPARQQSTSKKIQTIFHNYLKKAKQAKIICDKTTAQSYLYSLDNLTMPGRQMLYPKTLFSPTQLVAYEGYEVRCPRNAERFLDACYHEWPIIPEDLSILGVGHYEAQLLDDPNVKQALDAFLDE